MTAAACQLVQSCCSLRLFIYQHQVCRQYLTGLSALRFKEMSPEKPVEISGFQSLFKCTYVWYGVLVCFYSQGHMDTLESTALRAPPPCSLFSLFSPLRHLLISFFSLFRNNNLPIGIYALAPGHQYQYNFFF